MMEFPDKEPNAEMRYAANHIRQMYVALVQEGFEQSEALHIVGIMLSGGLRKDQ